MTSTPKRFSLRVPFSTDGTPTVITLPWLGLSDVPESPQVKTEGRPSDGWAGLLPQTPHEHELFRLSESLTPVPETPPQTPIPVTSQLRRSSRVASLASFSAFRSTTAGTSVSRAKGKDGRKSKGKGKATDVRSATPAQASVLATTLRGKSAGRKSRESDRYEPYPSSSFKLITHKIKNLNSHTRWFPVSSTHPIRTPPISKKNERRLQVNDLCINHLKGSGHVQTWIWTVDEEWVSISPGDSCALDGTTRFLVLSAAGVPSWVTRFIQKDTPVSVIPSSSTHAGESSADFMISDASGSSSTINADASAASLY